MSFFDNTTLHTLHIDGTGDWITALEADPTRRSLVLYAYAPNNGSLNVSLYGGDDDYAVTIQDGVMWEPRITPTNAVYVKAEADDFLLILADGNLVS